MGLGVYALVWGSVSSYMSQYEQLMLSKYMRPMKDEELWSHDKGGVLKTKLVEYRKDWESKVILVPSSSRHSTQTT